MKQEGGFEEMIVGDRKVKYAIIGTGEHALRSHALPGLNVKELELVALCDTNPDQLLSFENSLPSSCRHFLDERNLFLTSEIEAVVIATPDQFHAPLLLAAVKAGKHVLVEKPIAVSKAGLWFLDQALALAEKKGLVVTSCHPRRFDPPYVWVKRFLHDMTISLGNVKILKHDFVYHQSSNLEKHESLLIDHYSHEHDLMNWLLGNSAVKAFAATSHEDYHVSGIRQEDGVIFSFNGNRRLEERKYLEFLIIEFDHGELEVNCQTGKAILRNRKFETTYEHTCGQTDYEIRFTRVMENFALAILGQRESYLSHKDLRENSTSTVMLFEEGVWDNTTD